ncbi:MAG: ABC transporter ATP-binding protein [Propionibacteriaceae bacterium]|jgi:multidrug/hemolysin transport system ATP-binding protein|nr:ABC transporter ATP-binding protein [Propionibacteriaceae bacterium]
MTAIKVENLWKSYKDVQAVRGIDFTVHEGEFFAFLGVNGAGKSTTINCLTTLLKPDAGDIAVAGYRLGAEDQAIRDAIGVVFQRPLLDLLLTVRENLALRGEFHGLVGPAFEARVGELVDLLDLGEFIDRRYGQLSGGQQRRADIARALLHNPHLLFLDEPTAGLDPHSREQVWDAIGDVRQTQGMTVFLTTHYMEETERADEVSIIDAGQIVAAGTPADLRERYSRSQLTLTLSRRPGLKARLTELRRLPPPGWNPDRPLVLNVSDAESAKDLLAELDPWVEDFEFRHGSMDDVFLTVTERGGVIDLGDHVAEPLPEVSPAPIAGRPDPGSTGRPAPAHPRHAWTDDPDQGRGVAPGRGVRYRGSDEGAQPAVSDTAAAPGRGVRYRGSDEGAQPTVSDTAADLPVPAALADSVTPNSQSHADWRHTAGALPHRRPVTRPTLGGRR